MAFLSFWSFRENNFKCNSGLCIKKEKLCDSIQDCDDGSDETYRECKNKTCSGNLFQCGYGACVELEAKCNGKVECVDGTDEMSCCGFVSLFELFRSELNI